MGYYSLTEETAVHYAKEHGYFEKKANVICHEIGDGNLNYVFKLDDGEKTIIIKQALPYAKVVGESWPLSIKRATIESKALQIFAKYVPEYVPEVYSHDEELAVTVIEDFIKTNDYKKRINRWRRVSSSIPAYWSLSSTCFILYFRFRRTFRREKSVR